MLDHILYNYRHDPIKTWLIFYALNDSPKARLGIMTILAHHGLRDFSNLKEQLGLSNGNLGAHRRVLEEAGYVGVEKSFVNRRPRTVYALTEAGMAAFREHLDPLEELIRSLAGALPADRRPVSGDIIPEQDPGGGGLPAVCLSL